MAEQEEEEETEGETRLSQSLEVCLIAWLQTLAVGKRAVR